MNPQNPLLADGLPEFDRIRPEHAVPAVEQRLLEYRQLIERIEAGDLIAGPELIAAEVLADDALARAWSAIGHLHAVTNSPEWREAYSECLEKLTRFYTARGQNRRLFEAWREVSARPDFGDQPQAFRRMVEIELTDFRLAGVDLPGEERERFAEVSLRLSELGNAFGNHVLDATEGYSEVFDSADALAGLPEAELELLKANAEAAGTEGYRADLSFPCYRAIATYADDRSIRERFYTAHSTRASDQGPQAGIYDNSPVVSEILALRGEQARLLGYPDHAAMRLEKRMADSAETVQAFLIDLAARARPAAGAQLAELTAFACEHGGPEVLEPWDIGYWSEIMREATLGLSQEKLKPWFELERTLEGLFSLAGELFGIRVERDESVPAWHEAVRFYRVHHKSGQPAAGLYLDLYSRPRKTGGAWMDICRARLEVGGQSCPPVAYLTCNFAPPGRDRPSLLTHDDVKTLFHEFGHCLHQLLTRVDWPPVGGIAGVEWDAVELPSQLLEGWIWEPEFLDRHARHFETGQPLPAEWVEALNADRRFLGAMALIRQIEFALTDLKLHRDPDPDPVAIMREVHEQVAVTPLPEFNRYLMSFTHLFDGGYAAGYYSYLWAERLARDAFGLFRDQGLFDPETGRRLAEEILSVGGSRPMAESWQAFRGREARLEPLLEAYGIAA